TVEVIGGRQAFSDFAVKATVATEDDGTYSIGLPTGDYTLRFTADYWGGSLSGWRYLDASLTQWPTSKSDPGVFPIADGTGPLTKNVQLPAQNRLEGVIRDVNGPVDGNAYLYRWDDHTAGFVAQYSAPTRPGGRYRFNGLEPGTYAVHFDS